MTDLEKLRMVVDVFASRQFNVRQIELDGVINATVTGKRAGSKHSLPMVSQLVINLTCPVEDILYDVASELDTKIQQMGLSLTLPS